MHSSFSSVVVCFFIYFYFKQDNGVLIESMDGCFGLCRKMEKGHNLGTPKHGTLLFADQDDVDNFVNSYGKAGADMEQVKACLYLRHFCSALA